jgi:hypothetical protein
MYLSHLLAVTDVFPILLRRRTWMSINGIGTEIKSQLHILIHVKLPAGAFFSRFWGSLPSLPSTFKIFSPWKKSCTIISWPTFCDQYFWKFHIWNSRADKKRREIWMVKVNVIFNDIQLLICLTPLQVNWVMVIN